MESSQQAEIKEMMILIKTLNEAQRKQILDYLHRVIYIE